MKGWVIGIIMVLLFIIWVLYRMDWSELTGKDSNFMGKLKAFRDACCLGVIWKRK